MRVFTGDKWGAGTDANVFVAMTGEFGDSGERELKDSENVNKFEKNQEDVFKVAAVELGRLKKLKVRHDNKGGGAAWYLDRVEVEDPKNHKTLVQGAIASKIKHAIKHKTSPARLAQLLHNCCSPH